MPLSNADLLPTREHNDRIMIGEYTLDRAVDRALWPVLPFSVASSAIRCQT